MSVKNKFGWVFPLLLVAVVAVFAIGPVLADHTDTYNAATTDTDVGGLPLCVTFNGTHTNSTGGNDDGTLTVTLPTGFAATYVEYVDNATAGNAPVVYEWFSGMGTNASILHAGGTTAFSVTASADIDAATAGELVFDSGMTTTGTAYYGRACR